MDFAFSSLIPIAPEIFVLSAACLILVIISTQIISYALADA